ncbi:MAG TPA: porin, partial [Patescibacteria group bacterium]|nr:porin [Patescibacteria group bacterium]
MKERITALEAEVRRLKSGEAAHVTAEPAPGKAGAPVATGTMSAVVAPLQEGTPGGKPARAEPFAFADFTWLNGNPRTKEIPLDTKFFTPEIRADVDYVLDFNHPKDDTIGGS